jgi:hypothetical protein
MRRFDLSTEVACTIRSSHKNRIDEDRIPPNDLITMMQFDRAVQLNNEGAALLADGHEELAIDKFEHALGVMKCGLSHDESPPVVEEVQGRSPARPMHISPIVVACSAPDHSFVYSHALRIRSTGNMQTDMTFLSAAIIFNMALLFNIREIRDNSSSLQSRSLRLYEMSAGLTENLDSSDVDTAFLSVVCFNNISQIVFDQGEFERSRLMLSNLQHLMSGDLKPCLFKEDDIQGFMLNVMMMYPPTAARAA